ncbi:TNT domain-containing protein [Mycobacterium sp. 663a-19]|uniref:TNT domain-containing protein n=1 Tax=Mycobacterium sp. 663a-19 TaxID=2986148 RepID=UPI002D1F64BB|nr:TNT domain-containing protein [Mycobacterium sp. 663a-19]MEB3982021.1 TNT domain-containing protein [Mycobacterium sp. 663a-19]
MGSLTPADVKRWDLNAIHAVFETASGRANTLQHLGDSLNQAHSVLADWQGEAGDAFRADVGKLRRDIEADGAESKRVAAAVSRAEADVGACKRELDDIERAATANGWTITPDWRIDVGDTWIGRDPIEFAAEQQMLQDELNACKVHAHSADHELATAIGAAVGEVPLDAAASPPSGAPPSQGGPNPAPGGKPKTWQDMLLPGGPTQAGPDGAPASLPPAPAGGVAEPQSLHDLLTDDPPSDPEPSPAGMPGAQSRVPQPVGPGAPGPGAPPRPTPADIDSAKALLRPILIRDGVPPDQIEARLNDLVSQTQQWIDSGMPRYIPPEPPPAPPPGFAEGFGDRWRATEQGIKNLLGQGGPGAPGVLESWQQLLKGTVETAQNPIGAAAGEIKNAFDAPSPSYYLGAKASDGAFALPGLLFGGEGVAVEAGLPAETVTPGGAPLAVVRGWDPTGGMTWDDFASQFGTPASRNYPLNDGFPPGFVPHPAQLPEGAIIDRFGSEYGRYLAPDGTPFADRSLAPESVGGDYNRYMVTGKPLPPGWQIVEGPVEPWYGQTPSPGSVQYMILGPDGVKPTVWELVRLGVLDEYGPRLGR